MQPFKVYKSEVLVYSKCYITIAIIYFQKTYVIPQRDPVPVSSHSPFPVPPQPLPLTATNPVSLCGFTYSGHLQMESYHIRLFLCSDFFSHGLIVSDFFPLA